MISSSSFVWGDKDIRYDIRSPFIHRMKVIWFAYCSVYCFYTNFVTFIIERPKFKKLEKMFILFFHKIPESFYVFIFPIVGINLFFCFVEYFCVASCLWVWIVGFCNIISPINNKNISVASLNNCTPKPRHYF